MSEKENTIWVNEDRCRRIFKALLKEDFTTIRPDWLKYPETNTNLELDGYCEKLKLAFEYDGKQHYKYNKHMHKGKKENLIAQVKRDQWKDERCKELGITLIRIPYTVPFYLLQTHIYTKLKELGLK